ncbi:Ger(x)C family spore germination protein [Paenibacillus terrae]|uniref:Germination protein, ger(X)c family n=1 Tax=Paenibacillus terrae (strain HPL-003) TaxID=985665 RepID=G7W071_PAETH|nr:Ger(x)C family spore germination protein [Paenibacillus terrae]AET59089.1 germination protein, ger(x)c family [Paenibacillus terrae HPL-003]
MKSVTCTILIFSLLASLLTGCWDRTELNEIGITVGLGVDKDGDQIRVSAQVVVPSEVASKSRPSKGAPAVTTFEATAPTLYEAIQKITEISPRLIYLSHIRMLIFGEEFARQGIADIVESLMREPFARTDFYICVAKGTSASNMLQVATTLEKIPANKMFSSMEVLSKTWAPVSKVTIDQLMDVLVSSEIHATLPALEAKGDLPKGIVEGTDNVKTIEPTTVLAITSLAVFKKDRLIGWLDEIDSKGYNYIRDHVDTTTGHVDCPEGGKIALLALRSQTKTKVFIHNGEPVIQISVENKSTIRENNCKKMELKSVEDVHEIERESNAKIIEVMKHSVETVRRKFKVDIFGFGQLIHQTNPKAWKELKKDWDHNFMSLQIEYKANTEIKKNGAIMNSYQKKMKE